MSSSTPTQTILNRQQLYRQTLRILNTNSFHFITISLLFIPFTFSATKAVQFYYSTRTDTTTEFDPFNVYLIKTILTNSQTILTLKTLTTLLTFTLFVILPTVAGIALITYSTNQAINNKPLTFSSTIKSLSNSFIPLLSTLITASIKLILIFLLFTLSPLAITESIILFGFQFNQFTITLIVLILNTIISFTLLFTTVYLIILWGSAASISVLESKSLLKPLQQSANQSTEFRSHSFSIVFITAFSLATALSYSTVPPIFEPVSILQVGAVYVQSSLMILFYVVANTVLYVQGKAARGEEVDGAYVSVAVDEKDGEVYDDVAKEEDVSGGFSYMMYLLITVWVILLYLQIIG